MRRCRKMVEEEEEEEEKEEEKEKEEGEEGEEGEEEQEEGKMSEEKKTSSLPPKKSFSGTDSIVRSSMRVHIYMNKGYKSQEVRQLE